MHYKTTTQIAELKNKLKSFPYVDLGSIKTPIQHLRNLSNACKSQIYIKRDDVGCLALGGNKVRKLEYILPEIIKSEANLIITTGGMQSNHARATAAAARLLGLDCLLLLRKPVPPVIQGNYFLNHLFGCEIEFLSKKQDNCLDKTLEFVAERERAKGRKPFIVPLGGSTPLGSISYLIGMLEVLEQSASIGVSFDKIILAAGAGGTIAGLVLGKSILDIDIELIGVSVRRSIKQMRKRVDRLLEDTASVLELNNAYNFDYQVIDDFIGLGYGIPTQASWKAIDRFAREEGILLDPVYTGKTAAAMFDLIEQGNISSNEKILFWHTGGIPVLFEMANDYFSKKMIDND